MNNTRLISSRETNTGNLSEIQKKQVREINENPSFDPKTKLYKFIKVIKSDTKAHGWIFEFNGKIFTAIQAKQSRGSECVSIYRASKKGDYIPSLQNLVARYKYIVDIEHAVDKFSEEFKNLEL